MSSILTNTAAMTALKNLQSTNMALQDTQNRISTGLKVNSAADNAGYWSIATTMRSDKSSLDTVNSALGVGNSAVGTAYNGVTAAIKTAQALKDQLVSAAQSGSDRTKIQAQVAQLQKQLKSTADATNFNGQNILSVDSSASSYNATDSIMSSYSRTSAGVSIGTIDIDVGTTKLYDSNGNAGILDKNIGSGSVSVATLDISALTDSAADQTTLTGLIKGVDDAITSMTTAASNLGAVQSRIKDQQTFLTSLSDSLTSGISSLVDADMTTESTKLQALQVQQQLGTQALSIANQSSQAILKLFQ
ncbi:flagellin [Aestuariivirga litoralis]|uniref:flagellin N-terminal helical domain-containing protein n=1 Tax=Aestuariivirga litoralis TaxID=2650924 RepID=UPI0018C7B841|nr:flagellin [Aestuariivirga litoralis]